MTRRTPVNRATTFLVEQYVPGRHVAELRRMVVLLREAATRLDPDGPFRLVQATIVPHDASVLSLVSAASEAALRTALEDAGIDVDRISVAILDDARRPSPTGPRRERGRACSVRRS